MLVSRTQAMTVARQIASGVSAPGRWPARAPRALTPESPARSQTTCGSAAASGRGADPASALPRWLARIRSAVACTMPAVYHSPDHDLGGPRPAGFEEDKLPPLMKHIEQWTSGVTSARCRALFACAPFARENCPPALTEGARQTKVCGPGMHLARRRPGARYYSFALGPGQGPTQRTKLLR